MTAAFIQRLTLTNFRSYHAAQVSLERAGPVVLTGANGAGKTNLIEAISMLAPGRGLHRATMDELAFSEGDGSWAVSAEIEGMLGLSTLGTGIDPPAGEEAATNPQMPHRPRECRLGRRLRRSSARGVADAVDGPSVQRPGLRTPAFLDRLVLAVDAQHSGRVNALERSLRSRNRLLEDNRSDPHWLDAIEHETAEVAVAVAAARARNRQPSVGRARRNARSGARICHARHRARRLDGKDAAGARSARDRGSLSRAAEGKSRARRRRRPHARRAASIGFSR